MKIDLPRTPVGIAYVAAVVGLSLTSAGLAAALWAKVARPPRAVIVQGADGPRVVERGRVPDALARDFATDYLVSFETYSPATIEACSAFVRTRVAPSMLQEFTLLLENRKKLVRESGMVSQILLEDPARTNVTREEDRIEVVVGAVRRVYVADRLAQEARLLYRIALTPAQPTRDNPTGLLVVGQSVKFQPGEKDKDGKPSGKRD